MQSIEEYLDRVNILDSGCWQSPTSTQINVIHNNEKKYLIRAIFDYFNKKYNGKIKRSCGYKLCINPQHLLSLTSTERFWSNISIGNNNECWEWASLSGTNQYAETHIYGNGDSGHRIAYRLTFGEIPDGLYVCHHCDNPPCCNPKHLFLGTHQDNINDRERKGRNKLPRVRGEEHGNCKLTESQVREIRRLYAFGDHSYYSLADIYSVSFGHIRNIIKRRVWSWLK
jgi:hypothetical protein